MLSPSVAMLAGALERLEHAFQHADGDDARNKAAREIERVTLELASESALLPGDCAAKLRVLVDRLRMQADTERAESVTNYMLAESALTGLGRATARQGGTAAAT